MTLIGSLLEQEEGKTLEFKRDCSSPKPILKTIVAFANTAGGQLVLGVEDDKKLRGVDNPLLIEEKLTSLISNQITPFISPTIKLTTFKNKNIIIVDVPFLAHMGPFYLKALGAEKGVMVRLGSSTRPATIEMVEELNRLHHSLPFWREVGPYTDIIFKPLNMKKIHRTESGKLGPSRDQVGTKSDANQHPSKPAILEFCQEPKSLKDILSLFNRSNRTKFKDQYILPLIEANLLVMTIPDKPNSRLQKYVTTKKGLTKLKKTK